MHILWYKYIFNYKLNSEKWHKTRQWKKWIPGSGSYSIWSNYNMNAVFVCRQQAWHLASTPGWYTWTTGNYTVTTFVTYKLLTNSQNQYMFVLIVSILSAVNNFITCIVGTFIASRKQNLLWRMFCDIATTCEKMFHTQLLCRFYHVHAHNSILFSYFFSWQQH